MKKGKEIKKVKKNQKGKILVAMSGGVDSSVAAQLLKNQGYQVAGVFLHFWQDPATPSRENSCCSLSSFLDAQAVATQIGIPLYTFNFSDIFKKTVVDNFLQEYAAGRTPNPCVVCNKQVKMGHLLKQARDLGFDYVATGHYVRLKKVGSEIQLFQARDQQKDQSYFLYTFNQEELQHLKFPLGIYTKTTVRQLAKKFAFKVATKTESQDLCFVANSYHDFLKRYLALRGGEIRLLDTDQKIGEHQGLALYTIGQRRGLISGTGPYYVAKFDRARNILYVVQKLNQEALHHRQLLAQEVTFLSGRPLAQTLKCQAMIRYGHQTADCLLTLQNKKDYLVKFSTAQRAISPGQSVVFYQGKRLLGGGIIAKVL